MPFWKLDDDSTAIVPIKQSFLPTEERLRYCRLFRRPDFVFRCGTHIVILEVDENQHSNYQCLCEQTRMVNVTQTFGGTPVLWIRYNPDAFKGKHAMKKRGVSEAKRHKSLLKWLKWAFERDMQNLAEVVYLCYDGCDVQTLASEVDVLPSI